MGVAKHAPPRFERDLEHFSASTYLPWRASDATRCDQIARTRERVGMLLSQHPPPHAKQLLPGPLLA